MCFIIAGKRGVWTGRMGRMGVVEIVLSGEILGAVIVSGGWWC